MENTQEDPLAVHCFCVCSGSALLRDLLGVSRSMECDLSVLLIYPRIFLCVFIEHRLLVGFLFVWLYSAICLCVIVELVTLSVLAKWLAIQRPLWWHLHEMRRLSPQSPGGRACLCVFFFHLVCLCCYVFPQPYTICAESAVKHQANKQSMVTVFFHLSVQFWDTPSVNTHLCY